MGGCPIDCGCTGGQWLAPCGYASATKSEATGGGPGFPGTTEVLAMPSHLDRTVLTVKSPRVPLLMYRNQRQLHQYELIHSGSSPNITPAFCPENLEMEAWAQELVRPHPTSGTLRSRTCKEN